MPENLWDGIRTQLKEEQEEGHSNKQQHWKEYFEANKKAFDEIEEPPIELWAKIQTKLPQQTEQTEKEQSKFKIMPYLKIAVMLAIAFGLGWYLAGPIGPNFDKNTVDLQKMAPEVAEAETFYLTNIVAYKQDLQEYKQLNSELVEEFLNEHEALDALYDELKNMLLQDVDNEQILNLMIQNLQMRMMVLEKQNNILRNIQQQKKLGDDKTLL